MKILGLGRSNVDLVGSGRTMADERTGEVG